MFSYMTYDTSYLKMQIALDLDIHHINIGIQILNTHCIVTIK